MNSETPEVMSIDDKLELLIATALEGKPVVYPDIKTLRNYFIAQKTYNTLWKIRTMFKHLRKAAYREYTKVINSAAISDLDFYSLLDVIKLDKCFNFYNKECKNLEILINKYVHYIHRGRLLSTLIEFLLGDQ